MASFQLERQRPIPLKGPKKACPYLAPDRVAQWNKGWTANAQGKPKEANPHDGNSDAGHRTAWAKGWLFAELCRKAPGQTPPPEPEPEPFKSHPRGATPPMFDQ